MRVDVPVPPLAGQSVQGAGARRVRRAGQGFALPDTEAEPASGADQEVSGSQAPEAALACLAPQALLGATGADGAGPAAATDEQAAGHGRAILEALAGLQRAALGDAGEARGAARAALEALAVGLPRAADPGLDGVLRAIGQRAAVELARGALASGDADTGG